MTTPLRVVLWQDAGAPTPSDRRAELLAALLTRGHAVTCPAEDGAVAAADGADVLLLHESSALARLPLADSPRGRVRAASIAGVPVEQVAALVESTRAELGSREPGCWKPWFPVIDFSRCTNCMQCLSFCLFGVYGVDTEKKITVSQPDHCKTNCPACSRVCPEVAILFPKYGKGPINGDVVNAEDVQREKMKIDISALLGGDVYTLLRERHQRAASRFSKERDESRALEERKRCLTQLGRDLDVPPEVLLALPGPEEIRRKAGEAAARAAAALADASKKDEGSGT